MRVFFLFVLLTICSLSFGQQKTFKQRTNHVVSFGITNSMFWNNIEGINDVANYSKKQFIPRLELLSYLFSYEFNSKLEFKLGYTHYSMIENSFIYSGRRNSYSSSNPHFSFLIEYHPLLSNKIFFSIGMKMAFFPYENTFESYYDSSTLTPAVYISETSIIGVNPVISFGIGKKRILFNKYRIEWLFSYNHGTKSLRKYQFIRFDPYIESNLKAYDHHLSFTIRYYFKKYNQDEK